MPASSGSSARPAAQQRDQHDEQHDERDGAGGAPAERPRVVAAEPELPDVAQRHHGQAAGDEHRPQPQHLAAGQVEGEQQLHQQHRHGHEPVDVPQAAVEAVRRPHHLRAVLHERAVPRRAEPVEEEAGGGHDGHRQHRRRPVARRDALAGVQEVQEADDVRAERDREHVADDRVLGGAEDQVVLHGDLRVRGGGGPAPAHPGRSRRDRRPDPGQHGAPVPRGGRGSGSGGSG